jgi:hypothetical protein
VTANFECDVYVRIDGRTRVAMLEPALGMIAVRLGSHDGNSMLDLIGTKEHLLAFAQRIIEAVES